MSPNHLVYQKVMLAYVNVGSSMYDTDASVNSSVFRPRSDVMLQSPAQIDPFYTQG